MQRKKILFLVDDVWSLGEKQGVMSLYELLKKSDNLYDLTIFTTEAHSLDHHFPNAKIHYFKKIFSYKGNNRLCTIFFAKLNLLIVNFNYIISFLALKDKQFSLLYCSSSFPVYASIFIKKKFNLKSIHRMYGTFLYPILGNYLAYIKNFEEVLFFKSKTNKHIITNDGTYGDRVARYFQIPDEQIVFLRNGVNTFSTTMNLQDIYKKYNLHEDLFYILSVSRLVHWKRVDRIIKAMNLISNQQIHYLIVGDGPKKDELKDIVRNKNITFLGAKTNNEVRELMKIANIFVSMYDLSNLGNPLFEAFAEGKAIITYNSGDTSSVVDGQNAIIITSTDENTIVNELKIYIEYLFCNKAGLDKLANNALTYAKKHFYNWDTRIQMELDIINEVSIK